ncbi:secreted RxLR effector protein 161-like [Apium graveolens]|uniref:secreted RxLR effector protein 161-like n=1 Tax=Apium graveolens TaxID=4045 RepID=UPI003D7B18AE
MDPVLKLDRDERGKAVNPTQYKSLVGGLRYLVFTRPDKAYSVGIISRFMERPSEMHLAATKRILCYVNGTLSYGLIYSKGDGNYLLSGYSDSDLAGTWMIEDLLEKQKCVALSSCESEFMAATAAACQGIWLYKLLRQITDVKAGPVVIYIGNKSIIDLAKNPVFHGRSKHIDITGQW